MKIIIATIKPWNISNAQRFHKIYKDRYEILIITNKNKLNFKFVKRFNPRYIFFPHWSWTIPEKIYNRFECVVFHMTDLPFGRGGSPLQNLIKRDITKTKISALKVIKELDAGPIYLKRNLSLNGSAEAIYKRVSRIIFNFMIPYIIKNEPMPRVQKGKAVIFKRRKPKDSRIPEDIDLNGIYDHIRMLDANGYPHAFMKTQNLCFEFAKVIKKHSFIEARVKIKKRKRNES